LRKFLANENFPLASVQVLRSLGYDVKAIGVDSPGITDNQVMSIAIEEQRTILTFDRDYGELIFKYNHKPEMGVVFLRFDSYRPEQPGRIVSELIASGQFDLENALTVFDENGVRQRK
jgi:predicted nuclease of predicted toxin-antitoxin system